MTASIPKSRSRRHAAQRRTSANRAAADNAALDRAALNARARAIGHQIFAAAEEAQPRIWQKAWWMEFGTRMLDHDEELRAGAFQFVECLPALRTSESLMRHLREYLDPRTANLPKAYAAAVSPGFLESFRADLLDWGVRRGARTMAGRFITGYDVPTVIRTIERLRRENMAFTLDVLGEFTTSSAHADAYAQTYHDLLRDLPKIARGWGERPRIDHGPDGPMPRVNLSIKLTGLSPHFDAIDAERSIASVLERFLPLLRQAREVGAFLNIDTESYKHKALTFELFRRVALMDEFRDFPHIGVVLQAYLTDAEDDLSQMLDTARKRGTPFAIRLVKGAYWDAETAAAIRNHKTPPVWTQKWQSDACYERMAERMLASRHLIRPAFASHNVRSLAFVCAAAEMLGASPREYEVQALYGMGDPLKSAMVSLGRCLRVYCPYGDLMPGMGYLIRRLLENSSNEGFLKQSFSDKVKHDALLRDPAEVRPPSAPLPERFYQNTDPEDDMSTFVNASTTNFAAPENQEKMRGALQYVRGANGGVKPLIIGGNAITTGETCESHNPSNTREIVGTLSLATTADAEKAAAEARRAFPEWSSQPAATRAGLLRKVADRLEDLRFELAATMVLEVGKNWREADADVTEAIDHWRYYADQIEHIARRPRLRNIPGEDNMLTYVPKGVCAVLSPWAFPLAAASWMTSAALAAGNTVVLKPARQASILCSRLVEIAHGEGIPPGALNFLPGVGEIVGRHLVEHSDVNIVAFTGSSVVGEQLLRAGNVVHPGQGFIRKMIVEMGGKNAIIVDDDADLNGALQAIIESAFSFAGQKCSSASRLIVLDEIYSEMESRLRDALSSLVIGPADSPSTQMGPVIDRAGKQRIESYLELGKSEGEIVAQAPVPAECSAGYFVPPTVIGGVGADSRLAQEEIFGPVLTMLRAKDFDDALKIANNSRYALTGGLFSRSPEHIERAQREFAVGNLYINRKITGSQVDAQPFGGYKLSGTGVKAGSPDYLLHFMDARCITENTARSGFVPSTEHSEVS